MKSWGEKKWSPQSLTGITSDLFLITKRRRKPSQSAGALSSKEFLIVSLKSRIKTGKITRHFFM